MATAAAVLSLETLAGAARRQDRKVSVNTWASTTPSPRSPTRTSSGWSPRSEEHSTSSQEAFCLEMSGRVAQLSRDAQGTRRVQAALVAATSDETREALASEFRGQVARTARCPHGNHALQRCIAVLRPEALQFMVDELFEREALASQTARHRYGYRVISQLLKRCAPEQLTGLHEALLADGCALACHTFGSFAVKAILQHGPGEVRYRLVRIIEQNMGTIGTSKAGSGILLTALTHAAVEDRVWIARAAAQDPQLLVHLLRLSSGEDTVVLVLQLLRGRELEAARACLQAHVREPGHGRGGRMAPMLAELRARQ